MYNHNTNSSSQTISSTVEKDANKLTHDGIIPSDLDEIENNQKMISLVDFKKYAITRLEIAGLSLSSRDTQVRGNASQTK